MLLTSSSLRSIWVISASVVILHLGVFYLVSLPWFGQTSVPKPRQNKAVALKAYIVSAKVKPDIQITEPPQQTKPNPEPQTAPQQSPKARPQKEQYSSSPVATVSAEDKKDVLNQHDDVSQNKAVEVSNLVSNKPEPTSGNDFNNVVSIPQPIDTPSFNANFLNDSGKQAQSAKAVTDTLFIGRSYLQKQQQQAVSSLAEASASAHSARRSLSEMDGEMDILEGGSDYEISKELTLDHQFDPNRIVRIGDTCYRVVKPGDPINSHKENLGYPFFCGEDQVQQSIDKGIAEHLSRMNKSLPRPASKQ